MKVLVCHNFYQQAGGEDRVFADEAELLRRHGHAVTCYSAHNESIAPRTVGGRLALAVGAAWNRRAYRELAGLVRRERFDVVHFHNTFPLISPAAYYAARRGGAAVVQTLHNYRLLCPNALLFRDGRRCESCLGKAVGWAGIARGCYRGSRSATAVVAAVTAAHRAAGTWANAVDAYVAPTDFARAKFVAGGLPAGRVVVKPHFLVEDPGAGPGDGGYALFVGRLSEEKGLRTLLDAWPRLAAPLPLKIAGDGPLRPLIEAARAARPDVEWLGTRTPAQVDALLKRAAVLVAPSACHETFGRAAVEALATGTPAVVSAGGALAEVVEDGVTGFHFRAGDPSHLAERVDHLVADTAGVAPRRRAARAAFLARYTADANYPLLHQVYLDALARAAAVPARRNAPPCPSQIGA